LAKSQRWAWCIWQQRAFWQFITLQVSFKVTRVDCASLLLNDFVFGRKNFPSGDDGDKEHCDEKYLHG